MKLTQIAEIKSSLTQLGNEKLPIAYEIAKNIRACDKVITEAQEIAKVLNDKYLEKDETGNPRPYPDKDGRVSYRFTDGTAAETYRAEMLKLDSEEHDVDFVKIPRARLEGKEIAGTVLVPLLDVILID